MAILNHPESFRYPTTWHVRDYGLFAANPFGYDDFKYKDEPGDYTIPAGESIRFRYRVILHEGDTEAADIARGLPGLRRAAAGEVVGPTDPVETPGRAGPLPRILRSPDVVGTHQDRRGRG